MAKCEFCNFEIKKGAAFCVHCGRPVPVSEEISEDDFFNLDNEPEVIHNDLFDGLYGLNAPTRDDAEVEKPSRSNQTTKVSTGKISENKNENPISEEIGKTEELRPKRRRTRERTLDLSSPSDNIQETSIKENREKPISVSSDKNIVDYKDIAAAVKEYADETVTRGENTRIRREQPTTVLDDGRKKLDNKGKKKRKRERNYSEIDIYKLEQDLSDIKESDYDGYYEDILPIDHDRDTTSRLPIKTIFQAIGLILGSALVIYLLIYFMIG